MTPDARFEDLHFDNINELEAIVSSLPKAETVALHRGKTLNKIKGDTQFDLAKIDSEAEDGHIHDRIGIVNKETDEIVTTCSKKYEPIQHSEGFEPILDAIKKLGLNVEGRVRKVNNGSYVNVKARFKEQVFNIPGDSDYGQGFFFSNSFDKGSSVKLSAYWMRMVCTNGMVIQKNVIPSLKRKHLGNAQLIDQYKEWFEELMEESQILKVRLEEAREEHLHIEKALVNARVPGGIEEIEERLNRESDHASRKEIYDAVTNYISHELDGTVMPSTMNRYEKAAETILFAHEERLNQEIEVEAE